MSALSSEDREWLRRSRAASGVPDHLTDQRAVERITGLVLSGGAARSSPRHLLNRSGLTCPKPVSVRQASHIRVSRGHGFWVASRTRSVKRSKGIGYWTGFPVSVVEPGESAHGVRSMGLGAVLAPPTRAQQSNTDQQMSFRNRWSSSTSSRIASGSWSRCHRHSSRPAASPSLSGAAARAALIA
jgi:hypothetical protein